MYSHYLKKTTHTVILQEYGVPKPSLNIYLLKIYPLLQSRNISHLQKIVEVGDISPGNVREIIKVKVLMKKPV